MHTISQAADPLMAAIVGNHEAVLALSDERDTWLTRIAAAERAGFDRGREAQRSEDAERHRAAADHLLRVTSPPGMRVLQIRRWAPPGWRGSIPPGLDSCDERMWLARLPRRRDRLPR